MFVDPSTGDYRVRDGSPALTIGFKNFPMDKFGVQNPKLKAIARVPALPALTMPKPAPAPAQAIPATWMGATVAALSGEEFSAFGVSKDAGGVHLVAVPPGSGAAKAGFKERDLIQRVNGTAVASIADLSDKTKDRSKALVIMFVREQKETSLTLEAQ